MKKNGFTLIELMIVAAIIGILAAIIIPAVNDYTKRRGSVDGFGSTTAPAPVQRTDTISKCGEDGFLLIKEMGGDWRPDPRAVRCEK